MTKSTSTQQTLSSTGAVGHLDDGRGYVVFERRLAHPMSTVWAALTEPEQLNKWFPGIFFDREVGGEFTLWFGGECEGPAHVSGHVTEYDPPNLLAMGNMRWELTADGDECLLRFSDILFFDTSPENFNATNSVLSGWHKYLDVLEYALSGGKVDPTEQPEVDYSKIEVPGRDSA